MDFLSALFTDWMAYDFMKTALLAVLLIAPLYAILGTMVVDQGMSFFADSLGHSAMTGIALGVMLGLETPIWAMLIFGVAYAVLLSLVKSRGAAGVDTTLGVFSSTGLALGVVLLSKNGGFARFSGYLIGDLLAIERAELWPIAAVLLLVVLYWFFAYNRLLQATISRDIAMSRGVRAPLYEMSFSVLLAVVVMLSIRFVGILIISAMLILPSAAARNIAKSVRAYHFYAMILSVVCGVFGLLLSFPMGTASGATIVLLLSLFYAITLMLRGKMKG